MLPWNIVVRIHFIWFQERTLRASGFKDTLHTTLSRLTSVPTHPHNVSWKDGVLPVHELSPSLLTCDTIEVRYYVQVRTSVVFWNFCHTVEARMYMNVICYGFEPINTNTFISSRSHGTYTKVHESWTTFPCRVLGNDIYPVLYILSWGNIKHRSLYLRYSHVK